MGSQCCKCSNGKKQHTTDYNSENINIRFHGKHKLSRINYRIETYGNAPNSRSKLSQRQNIFHHLPIDQNLTDNYRLTGNARKEYYWRDQMNIQNISIEPQEGEPPIFIRRFTDLAAKVGTRIRFLVEIESSPSPKVTWHRDHKEVDVAESRFSFVHEGNFYCIDIAQVRIDDEGYWTCLAENIHGRSSCTSCLSLIIPKAYKKPHFVEELRALLTETGTVSLECKVVGIPTPVLKWFKDDKEIKAGDVFALTAAPDDKTSLGIYTCEATNCMGTAHSSSKIHVIDRDSGEYCRKSSGSLPVFEKILKDKSCKIGDDVSLSCQVVVPPWPKDVTWYNKTGRIKPNEKYNIREDGLGMYSIEIKAVQAVDEREWKCVATSLENAKQFTTCYISMIIPKNYRIPRFMEGLKAVLTEEGLVSFECKVVGFPTPVLKWFKDGQELKPGDVYQLTGRNSLGLYCCIATNCMGEAKSTAQLTMDDIEQQLNEEERLQLSKESSQVPKFIRGLKSCEAIINENFKFTTQLNSLSSPEPSVSWYRNDQHIVENDKYKLIKESLDTFHIEIKKLELIDQAEWKCVAENDFGHSVTSCFLKLIIPSHFKKPKYLENLRAVFSKEGTVNLECKVIGVPQPVLKWYKDGLELKPGDIHRIISGENGTCCLGIYTCEATNCMGSVSSSASLLGFENNANEEPPKENQSLEELARNLSLSTIHEERTSQLYDTPQTEHSLSLDDRGEVSFSFDGKEVSVSLYETPDLTEEDAIQIIEMYADQLSEHINESNVVELPPMRFVKETSTSGNLLMEAIVIDISPDYFIANENVDDLCTEVDVEDVSIMDDQTQSIMSSYSSAVADKAPQKPLRKKQSENGSSKSEHSEKNQQKSTPTLDLSESYYSAKELSSMRDNSADPLSSSINTNNVSLINNEQKNNVNEVVAEQEPIRAISTSTSNINLNYNPESLFAIESKMIENEPSEIINYPKYSQIIEEELTTAEESALYRSPGLLENASIIFSNIHFALSSALEKVSTSILSNNNQTQNKVTDDINLSVCNLLSEIENMRQCVGDITITFADPIITSISISEYASNPVSDKFINLKAPLQYIKRIILSRKCDKECQYIFNSVASPMENLREAIMNLSEEIYIEPEIIELLDDVTENIFSIKTAEFYQKTDSVNNPNEDRLTVICEPSTREISEIIIEWLDSLDTWLTLTSIEEIYPEPKRSNLIVIVNCVKKELFNITSSNHHSKASSQILALSQQLLNLKESLEHILGIIIQHRDEIDIAIIDELTLPIERMFEASLEISSINETDNSLIQIIEDLRNEIASRVCMMKQDSMQHMEKLLAYEFPIDESFTALNKINIVPFHESDSENLISKLSNSKIIDPEKYTSTTLENKIDNEKISVLSKAEDAGPPQIDINLKQRRESEIVSNLKRSEQLNAWTLTIIEPLNRIANTGLSLDRSIEEQVHTLLCKPLHSLHKQIDLMASQMNRSSPGQTLENDVETIIEGFLWPANQLQNAIELATNVWKETPPNVQVRGNLDEFVHSTSDLCEQLISLREELIRGAPESSLQIQKADTSLIETITAVLGPLQNIQNIITVTLDNLTVEKYEENNTMLSKIGELENTENNNRDSNCEDIMKAHTTPTNSGLNLVEELEDIQNQFMTATSEKAELLNLGPENITKIHTTRTNRELNLVEGFEATQNQFESQVKKTDISNISTTTSKKGELLNLNLEDIMETHTTPINRELNVVEEFEYTQNQFESQVHKANISSIAITTSEKGELLNLSPENIPETHTTSTESELKSIEEFEHNQNQFESQVEKADIPGITAAISEEGGILNRSHENIMETHTKPINRELNLVEEFEGIQNRFESQVQKADISTIPITTSEKGKLLNLSPENILETHTTPTNSELKLVDEFKHTQNQSESQVKEADIPGTSSAILEKGEILNLRPESIVETHTTPTNRELNLVEEFKDISNQFELQVKKTAIPSITTTMSEEGESLNLNPENILKTHTTPTNSDLELFEDFEHSHNQLGSQVKKADIPGITPPPSEKGEILNLIPENMVETHTTATDKELNLVEGFKNIQDQFQLEVQKANISSTTTTTSDKEELSNLSPENIRESHTTSTNNKLNLVGELKNIQNQSESQVKKADIAEITAAISEKEEISNFTPESIIKTHTTPRNTELNLDVLEDIKNQLASQVQKADIPSTTTTISEKGEILNLSPESISTLDPTSGKSNDNSTESLKKQALSTLIYSKDEDSKYKKSYDSEIVHDSSLVSMDRVGDEPSHEKFVLLEDNIVNIIQDELYRQSALELASISLLECIKEKVGHIISTDSNMNEQSIFEEMVRDITVEELQKFKWANENTDQVMRNEPSPTINLVESSKTNLECNTLNQQNILEFRSSENEIKSDLCECDEFVKCMNVSEIEDFPENKRLDDILGESTNNEEVEENIKKLITAQLEEAILNLIDVRKLTDTIKCQLKQDTSLIITEPISDEKIELLITTEIEGYKKNFFKADKNINYECDLTIMSIEDSIKRLIMMEFQETLPILLNRESNTRTIEDDVKKFITDYLESLSRKFPEGMIREFVMTVFETKRAEFLKTTNTELKEVLAKQVSSDNTIEHEIEVLVISELGHTFANMIDIEEYKEVIKSKYQETIFNYPSISEHLISNEDIEEIITMELKKQKVDIIELHHHDEMKNICATQTCIDITPEEVIKSLITLELENSFAKMIEEKQYTDPVKFNVQLTLLNNPKFTQEHVSEEHIGELIITELEKQKLKIIEAESAVSLEKQVARKELNTYETPMILKSPKNIELSIPWEFSNENNAGEREVSQQSTIVIVNNDFQSASINDDLILHCPQFLDEQVADEPIERIESDTQVYSTETVNVHLVENDKYEVKAEPSQLILVKAQLLEEHFIDEGIENMRRNELQEYNIQTVNVNLVDDNEQRIGASHSAVVTPASHCLYMEDIIDNGKYPRVQIEEEPMMMSEKSEELETSKIGLGSDTEFVQGDDILNVTILIGDLPVEHENASKLMTEETNKVASKSIDNSEMNQASTDAIHSFNPSQSTPVEFHSQDESPIAEEKPINVDPKPSIFLHEISKESIRDIVRTEIYDTKSEASLYESDVDAITRDMYEEMQTMPKGFSLNNLEEWAKKMVIQKLYEMNMEKEDTIQGKPRECTQRSQKSKQEILTAEDDNKPETIPIKEESIDEKQDEISRTKQEEKIYTKRNTELAENTVKQRKVEEICDKERKNVEETYDKEKEGLHSLDTDTSSRVKMTALKNDGAVNSDIGGMMPRRTMVLDNFEEEKDKQSKESRTENLEGEQNKLKEKDIPFGKKLDKIHPKNKEMDLIKERDDIRLEEITTEGLSSGKFTDELLGQVKQELVIDESFTNVNITENQSIEYKKNIFDSEVKNDDTNEYREKYRRGVDESKLDKVLLEEENDLSLEYSHNSEAEEIGRIGMELHESEKLQWHKEAHVRSGSSDNDSLISTDSPLSSKCNVKFLNANERDVSTHLPSISIGCDESLASDQSRYSDPLYTSSRIYHQSDNEGLPSSFDYSSAMRLASSGPRDNAKKPIFCMKLTNRNAITASRIKLTCTVLGEPEPHITWLKNNKELEELSNRYCITNDNGIISLEIYSLRIEDSGEYSCVAKNIHGRACTEAKLKVYAGYESTPSVPIFTRSIRDKFKVTEDKLVLECKVKAQPSPMITWLKDDKVIIIGNRYKQSDLPDGICRLEISNPCVHDNGTYICRAKNESGFSDSTSHVIDCGNKDENHQERSTTSCRSGSINYDGINTERFTNKPYFSSYLTNHTVPAGGTIGLQVQIESASIPEVTWLRHDTRTPIFVPKAQSFADHNIYTLVLPNASESESGTYICRASNAHGYVDSAARVEIVSRNLGDNGKPAIFLSRPVDKLIHAYTGEDVSLSFRTTGVPKPRVILMKGLTDITNGARAYKESHDDYVRITFKRVQISDEGTYCILVKNRYGCDRSFFTLRIKQRARSLTPSVEWSTENMENFLSYIQDTNQSSYCKRVPGTISSKPVVIDGGKSWLALTWGKAESRSTAPVTAYRVDAWLLGGDGGARWVELGITPTNSFDAFNLRPGGEYKFRVTPRNRYGWGESVTMENSVRIEEIIAFPEFTKILPGQLKVLKGTMLHLSCEISSDSATHIRWYKDSAEIYISEDPRLSTNRSGSKCTLSIRDVVENDSGRYVCDATNSAGRVSTFARVQVVTDPKIVEADMKFRKLRFSDGLDDDRPPEFTMRLRDRRVQTTFPVRLTCQVSGYPEPEVTWYKYEQKINLQVENITISKDEAHFHTLEINRAKIDDTGIYMASAKNLYGCVSCRCHLVVDEGIRAYIAPEFSQHLNEVYIVNRNEELRMNAQVKAYPAVGITWYRDGKHLRPGRNTVMSLNHDGTIELTLAHMTNRDAGLYCCVAINEVGRAESITKVQISASYEDINSIVDSSTEIAETSAMPYSKAPVFIKKPLSTEAFEGDNIIIMCEVIGDPKPEVIWLRDFLRPDYYKDSPLFRRIGLGPQYRLEIPYAKLDFTGTYSVIAKNPYGEAKAVISLQIYARDPDERKTDVKPNVKHGEIQTIPILKNSLKDIRCCDGDAITFSCKIYAIPSPNIRWERAGKLVVLGGDITTDFDGEVARLHIEHVYPEDEGEYLCIAYNSLGNIHTSACLIVDVPEGKEISLNRRLKKPTSLLSLTATPISTPRLTPVRSLSPSCLKHELRPTLEGLYTPKRGHRAKIPTTPKFYAVPHNRVVEEGDTVRFQCAVAGHPMPWAHWDKDGIAVMSNARISIIEKNDLRILEIVEIIYDDAGLYRITLENEIGRVEATARLEVIRGRYSMISRGTIKQSSSEIHPVYHPPCHQYSSSSICTPNSSILDGEYIRERALSPTFLHKLSHYRSVNF